MTNDCRMDFVSFVLQIPNTVEGFVKTARTIVAYKQIESKYIDTLNDSIYYAEKLRYLSHFIDGASFPGNKAISQERPSGGKTDNSPCAHELPTELQHQDEGVLTKESQQILFELFQNAMGALDVAQKVVLDWALRLGLGTSTKSQQFVTRLSLSLLDRVASTRTDINKKRNRISKIQSKLHIN